VLEPLSDFVAHLDPVSFHSRSEKNARISGSAIAGDGKVF
jgi:hypothetical protein